MRRSLIEFGCSRRNNLDNTALISNIEDIFNIPHFFWDQIFTKTKGFLRVYDLEDYTFGIIM
jgi:hypothetical protein